MHKTHGAYAESVILTQFLLELEGKYGENALIEYWYAMILVIYQILKRCFTDHLIDFCQRKLIEF
jgi:hypothetical protein